MEHEESKKKILNRLKTIKGHIGGVEKMIADDQPCEDIALQISAIRASVHKVGMLIMEDYAKECITSNVDLPNEDIHKLEKVIHTLLEFTK
ncbi:MAG: metal-sensitive transcriptional regulator [Bacillota bacterium]|nr:metal-sensitive transcriptional regulator [Bacillota bacterium]